jgi:hypothetical protein
MLIERGMRSSYIMVTGKPFGNVRLEDLEEDVRIRLA